MSQHQQAVASQIQEQEARMNKAYATLLDNFDTEMQPDRKAALRSAQEFWVKFRDANCKYYASEFQRGSMAPVALSNCILRMTAERATELEEEVGRALD